MSLQAENTSGDNPRYGFVAAIAAEGPTAGIDIFPVKQVGSGYK
uniref:Uncharacterized protein n=1 Tax=Arthrobacter sp. J3.37 TaxID=347208 RepID=I3W0U7_9MICC|nr:hypothetical protein [Arthrobacter sp. J3.37]AFK89224.1 hypothetical protein [Arthrobacter sp. J3.37]